MKQLKEKLAAIVNYLPRERPVVYLDYPVHLNFGDILIMRGTEQFFSDYAYRVIERAGYMNFTESARRAMPADAVIVLHGGGNFGDLYPVHQKFREAVVCQFPRHRIVLLPQTVHFQSEQAKRASAAVFRRHPDVLLMVRDQRSMEAVEDLFTPKVLLMPDMAHQLWGGLPAKPASRSGARLDLRRKDIEATEPDGAGMEAGRTARDWMDFVPVHQRRVFGLILRWHMLEAKTNRHLGARQAWYAYCDRLAARMQRHFEPYSVVQTSRLHGMIFAALLGKQVVFDDNSYGKLGHYADQWFNQHPGIHAG
ncbi:polysaccharide pyruvyl transferase family protein [Rhodoferax sp. U11-2br]|uniref:polysaccharide pyruvyl transferase family protein n=1 Tax=Rhodoferax sp. U11-2br TaxID=2838878 RepID=UPI001BE80A7B|nr:polysaccharide pyruvyl transferase family protein [Rhodoferax sp. U11-2br]MBT3068508.1 polysaccharide pyruvyl transferase family protein [Rhodoferax sp. U11-2br]